MLFSLDWDEAVRRAAPLPEAAAEKMELSSNKPELECPAPSKEGAAQPLCEVEV